MLINLRPDAIPGNSLILFIIKAKVDLAFSNDVKYLSKSANLLFEFLFSSCNCSFIRACFKAWSANFSSFADKVNPALAYSPLMRYAKFLAFSSFSANFWEAAIASSFNFNNSSPSKLPSSKALFNRSCALCDFVVNSPNFLLSSMPFVITSLSFWDWEMSTFPINFWNFSSPLFNSLIALSAFFFNS